MIFKNIFQFWHFLCLQHLRGTPNSFIRHFQNALAVNWKLNYYTITQTFIRNCLLSYFFRRKPRCLHKHATRDREGCSILFLFLLKFMSFLVRKKEKDCEVTTRCKHTAELNWNELNRPVNIDFGQTPLLHII